jgi:hypothetical protein
MQLNPLTKSIPINRPNNLTVTQTNILTMTKSYDDEETNFDDDKIAEQEDEYHDNSGYVDYFCRLHDEDDEDDDNARRKHCYRSSFRHNERCNQLNDSHVLMSAYKRELLTDNMMALEQAYKANKNGHRGLCDDLRDGPHGHKFRNPDRLYRPPSTVARMSSSLARTMVEEALKIVEDVDDIDKDDCDNISQREEGSNGCYGSGEHGTDTNTEIISRASKPNHDFRCSS